MLHFKVSDGDVKDVNGWGFTTKTGIYGTDYLQRALVTAIGLGANRPQDAVYPTSLKQTRTGQRAYTARTSTSCTFKKGQMPPVQGFWSLTMYDAKYFFVEQPAQPLLDQRAAAPEGQRRRLGRPLHPERVARAPTRNRTGCPPRRTSSS